MEVKIPLFKVFMSNKSIVNAVNSLNSGYIGQGKKVEEFEEELKQYFNSPYVVSTNSATSAIHLALRLLTPKGSEWVIPTTPQTCTATNWPIVNEGHEPYWCDVDENLNIDLDDLEKRIYFTGANLAMVLHWGGNPLDMDKLVAMREKIRASGKQFYIIEDCAHSFGATFKGKQLPEFGNICVYSFQAIKHITCVDGGVLVLPNEELYRRAKLLRWYGIDREEKRTGDFRCELPVMETGWKYHMNDVSATIGLGNLNHKDEILRKHRDNASFYEMELRGIVKTPQVHPEANPSWWLYTIFVERRDDFIRKMLENGIQVSKVHERNDIHPCVKQFHRRELTKLDELSKKMVSLPVGWWVSEENREFIVETIKKGW